MKIKSTSLRFPSGQYRNIKSASKLLNYFQNRKFLFRFIPRYALFIFFGQLFNLFL